MNRRLIIDTDIGTDVDDLWTLAMLPSLENVQLVAVTVVYGNTQVRAHLASLVLASMGINAPVYRGMESTMSGKAVMWAGYEGEGIDDLQNFAYATGDAVDVLIAQAKADPGSLDVVAIGPLTNIAMAIQRDAEFASNLGHLTVMGGEFSREWPEHNFSADAKATQIVLTSGIPTTIIPLNQTLRVMIGQSEVERIAEVHPIGQLMADQAHRFWEWLAKIVPFATGNSSAAHDPLALLALLRPEFFTFTAMALELLGDDAFDGRVHGTPDENSVIQVVTDLDIDAVREAFLNSLQVFSAPSE